MRMKFKDEWQYLEVQGIITKVVSPNAMGITCCSIQNKKKKPLRKYISAEICSYVLPDLKMRPCSRKWNLMQATMSNNWHLSLNTSTTSKQVGLKRYRRLIFGISSAAEVLQHVIQDYCLCHNCRARPLQTSIFIYLFLSWFPPHKNHSILATSYSWPKWCPHSTFDGKPWKQEPCNFLQNCHTQKKSRHSAVSCWVIKLQSTFHCLELKIWSRTIWFW